MITFQDVPIQSKIMKNDKLPVVSKLKVTILHVTLKVMFASTLTLELKEQNNTKSK
jgi:hypothetical protein